MFEAVTLYHVAQRAEKKRRSIYRKILATNYNQDEHEKKNQHYPYIPYNTYRFVGLITQVVNFTPTSNPSFVDVGCGIGDKLMIAHDFCGCGHVTGIEYNAETVAIARKKFGKKKYVNIIQGDAFEQDFSTYDIIYMYCPIHDTNLMRKLFIHILISAKVGAIIIETLPHYICGSMYYPCLIPLYKPSWPNPRLFRKIGQYMFCPIETEEV